ncbi:MAG: CTP synthase, partial [Candidatus Shapirobacteria bacterium]
MKFIFVTGGVVSGLGKGITAASIGLLLESRGYIVTNVKIDMYLNIDAGTIRPQEHGEVFVCDDGIETDQDLGNYERFLGRSLRQENYMTTGQVYKTVIDKERAMEYKGEDVEAIPHLTDEIIRRVKVAGKVNKADVVIVELGGTVGEYQNGIFYEASRILRLQNPKDVIQIHVSYLPVIKSLGELKSKPAQQSVHLLNSMGIMPDFLIARSEKEIDQRRRERLAMFCNMSDGDIIANPDLKNIYEVPLFLEKQMFSDKIIKKLHLTKRVKNNRLIEWTEFVEKLNNLTKEVRIAMVGKYFATGSFTLTDAYLCVMEALKHAGAQVGVKVVVEAISTDDIDGRNVGERLKGYAGIIVPQGWGSRGVEGKLATVKYARENKIPYLGLCFG